MGANVTRFILKIASPSLGIVGFVSLAFGADDAAGILVGAVLYSVWDLTDEVKRARGGEGE